MLDVKNRGKAPRRRGDGFEDGTLGGAKPSCDAFSRARSRFARVISVPEPGAGGSPDLGGRGDNVLHKAEDISHFNRRPENQPRITRNISNFTAEISRAFGGVPRQAFSESCGIATAQY